MSRIQAIAERADGAKKKLLIPYLVAGDPNTQTTLALMHELVVCGADIIELGFPFSDPSSDGPVIQRGAERALSQGITLLNVLTLVRDFRQQDQATAVVLMGYLNPIEILGYAVFVEAAASAGVDGVLVVDLPTHEAVELKQLLTAQEIDMIFLVAPTTQDSRLGQIADASSGYLYYVSLKGVTGAALTDYDSVAENITKLRTHTDLPIVVGFGIKDAASAQSMAALADGVIIGSALVEQIEKLSTKEVVKEADISQATALIALARTAIDNIK